MKREIVKERIGDLSFYDFDEVEFDSKGSLWNIMLYSVKDESKYSKYSFSWDSGDTYLTLNGYREETDEEQELRLIREKQFMKYREEQEEEKEKREREEYERLKKKFEK